MKNYVINLDRRVERWQYVREHLADLGIKVIRFSAIDTKPGWVGCRESHLRILELCKDEEIFCIFEYGKNIPQ
jgi:GR25 family glycosyltransferase involved in LPS biosynthesis